MGHPNFLNLPAEVLQIILQKFSTKERARFFCVSSGVRELGKLYGARFFRSITLRIVQPEHRASAARWLESRKDVVQNLALYEYEQDLNCSLLQHLAGYPLVSLEWGAIQSSTRIIGDLCLPDLRALTLISCGYLESTSWTAVHFEHDFSQLSRLQQLWIGAAWDRVHFVDDCIPHSLTGLYIGPRITTGYLPEALATATQLRSLRIAFPKWATCAKLKNLCCLTVLELWHAQIPGSELSCMTALESLALWNPYKAVLDSHLESLKPLTRLSSLALIQARFERCELPPALGDLTSLRQFVISPTERLWSAEGWHALSSLTRLSQLQLPGGMIPSLPAFLTALTDLEVVDLGFRGPLPTPHLVD